ncbi:hypothetical protein ACIOEX_10485 [Streptomyces sp. NPDC087850]|uniref:hypothetical protein n=1 Tax=Streptomyces sp. NPDC087850 TaxID=3365809 RepID=UPI00380F3FAD
MILPEDRDTVSYLQLIRERIALRRELNAAKAELEKVRKEMIATELRMLDDAVFFERIFGRPQ